MNLYTIGQIAISVKDLDLMLGFYRDTLGLTFLFQVPHMAFFDCDGVRLMLAVPEGEEPQTANSLIYFRVDDLKGHTAELKAAGVEITAEPHKIAELEDHELWMSFFKDPEGNMLALMSEVR